MFLVDNPKSHATRHMPYSVGCLDIGLVSYTKKAPKSTSFMSSFPLNVLFSGFCCVPGSCSATGSVGTSSSLGFLEFFATFISVPRLFDTTIRVRDLFVERLHCVVVKFNRLRIVSIITSMLSSG